MRLSRFELVVWSVVGLLIVVTGLIILRGDQVGVAVVSAAPTDGSMAAASAPIVIQFGQKMDAASVEAHFQIRPIVLGNFNWRQNTMYFLPSQAFDKNIQYQVTLTAGAQSHEGHILRKNLSWSFGVREAGVAFLRRNDQGTELWAMLDLKSQPMQLSNTNGGVFDYTVAIDGEHLIYSAVNVQSGIDLWEVSRAGGDAHKLLDCGADRCFTPAWSADGRIAYSRAPAPLTPADPYGAPRVWLLDPQTGQDVRIYADTQKIGVGPSWSPDANHLAYYDGVQARIVVLDVLNGNETYLPSVAGVMGSWSPDGKQMIYFDTQTVSNVSVNLLYRADFETQDVLPFFDPQPTDADYSNPAVSPDGAWVAMRVRSREQGSDDQVWITPADGSFATVVTNEPGYLYSNYSWDPWAKSLLYYRLQLRGAGHRPEIWLWLQETGATGLLVEDGNSPLWLP